MEEWAAESGTGVDAVRAVWHSRRTALAAAILSFRAFPHCGETNAHWRVSTISAFQYLPRSSCRACVKAYWGLGHTGGRAGALVYMIF